MSTLSLPVVKQYLAITSGTHDTVLQGFIDAAEAAIAAKCGPLAATAVEQQVEASAGTMMLSTFPVLSLTSITPAAGGAALSLSGVTLDGPSGVVSGVSSGTYVVAYSAGRNPVPADLLMGVKELVRHLWDTQRGPTRRPGSTTSETTANTIPGAAYMMPFRVAELIAPHLLPGFA